MKKRIVLLLIAAMCLSCAAWLALTLISKKKEG